VDVRSRWFSETSGTLMSHDFLLLLLAAAESDPPLQFRIDTLLFSLLIFVLLVVVLARYAWIPIMEGLEKREKSIARDIDDAKTANEKAQATLARYESKLQAAKDEASALVAEARKDAEAAREKILARANEEAQRQRRRALDEIAAAKDQAVRELAERSVDSAVSLAGRLVGKELTPEDHQRLIEQSLERFAQSG
jgi:F-type H+-transporting ATPase subunit b